MKIVRKFICVLFATLLSVMLLVGCDQNSEDSEYDIFEGHRPEETEEDTWSFYGCWKNEVNETWIIFYDDDDCTYEMYWGIDETGITGTYEVYGDRIRLDAGPSYTPNEDGYLVNVSGDILYPAEPPAFIYDVSFNEDDYMESQDAGWVLPDDSYDDSYVENQDGGWDSSDGGSSNNGGGSSYDDSYMENQDSGWGSGDASDFLGCWEYQYTDRWLYIYDNGTYEWYDEDGFEYSGSYYVEGDVLYLLQDELSFEAKFGGIVDNNDNLMFSSLLPDYDGTAMNGAEDFIGCWEDVSGGLWLEIYSDGTYMFMWDDGFGSAGGYYMDGDELCLQSGTRFYMNYENGMIISDDYTMFPSEMPDYLR